MWAPTEQGPCSDPAPRGARMSGTHVVLAAYVENKEARASATRQGLGGVRGLTEAGLVVLGEAGGALAAEGAHGVDAEELAVVVPGGALVQVCGTDGPRGLRAGPPRVAGFPGATPQRRLPTPCSGEGVSGRGRARGLQGGGGRDGAPRGLRGTSPLQVLPSFSSR